MLPCLVPLKPTKFMAKTRRGHTMQNLPPPSSSMGLHPCAVAPQNNLIGLMAVPEPPLVGVGRFHKWALTTRTLTFYQRQGRG